MGVAIRTTVYIDGYNLYYGRLRGTEYKWLDVVQLFEGIIKIQDPAAIVDRVRLFTAPAKEAFASHGKDSVIAQQTYHRALEAKHRGRFSIQLGSHAVDKSGSLKPRYVEGVRLNKEDRVRIWDLEEKQTDVNLALAIYRDCTKSLVDMVVVVSNDSDVEPALKAVREDFPEVRIGVIAPVPPVPQGSPNRRISASLRAQADWGRQYLLDEELAEALLPQMVPTAKTPARKPAHW